MAGSQAGPFHNQNSMATYFVFTSTRCHFENTTPYNPRAAFMPIRLYFESDSVSVFMEIPFKSSLGRLEGTKKASETKSDMCQPKGVA